MSFTEWLKSIFDPEPDVVWIAAGDRVYYIDRREISFIVTTDISTLYFLPDYIEVGLSMKNGDKITFELNSSEYRIFHELFIKYSGPSAVSAMRNLLKNRPEAGVWTND